MTILSAQSIRARCSRWQQMEDLGHVYAQSQWGLLIKPWEPVAKQTLGMSYGLSSCGYDIRLGKVGTEDDQSYRLKPGECLLAASLEYFELPWDLCGWVKDKSTLARKFVTVQNTVLEPGWRGYITLELVNHSPRAVTLLIGQPIAQVQFAELDRPTDRPYVGKYQDQPDVPVVAIASHSTVEDQQGDGQL